VLLTDLFKIKKRREGKSPLFSFLLFLVLSVQKEATGKELVREIANGVIYKEIKEPDKKRSFHLLTVDPHKARISIAAAKTYHFSSETTSAIAKRTNAVAAINGSFFAPLYSSFFTSVVSKLFEFFGYSSYQAYPIYGLKIAGQWVTVPHLFTGMLGWKNGGLETLCDAIRPTVNLTLGNISYPVKEINTRSKQWPVIYTPFFGQATPARTVPQTEIVVTSGLITALKTNCYGATPLLSNQFVYSIDTKESDSNLLAIKLGQEATLTVHCQSSKNRTLDTQWSSMDYCLASTPILLYKKTITSALREAKSDFYVHKEPRTAVGIRADGVWVFLVADGHSAQAQGLSLLELAETMQQLDCIYALNLDGGGSSTMVVQGSVINKPSDHFFSLFSNEKPVSHALVIHP
jgi:exopolysaccharide biosynthesis protein